MESKRYWKFILSTWSLLFYIMVLSASAAFVTYCHTFLPCLLFYHKLINLSLHLNVIHLPNKFPIHFKFTESWKSSNKNQYHWFNQQVSCFPSLLRPLILYILALLLKMTTAILLLITYNSGVYTTFHIQLLTKFMIVKHFVIWYIYLYNGYNYHDLKYIITI